MSEQTEAMTALLDHWRDKAREERERAERAREEGRPVIDTGSVVSPQEVARANGTGPPPLAEGEAEVVVRVRCERSRAKAIRYRISDAIEAAGIHNAEYTARGVRR